MCYECNRPKSVCLCQFISKIDTKTKFVILMHPKEFRYIKNNTGRLTHLSLSNSELLVGVDFSDDRRVNALIDDPNNYCAILYPSNDSTSLNNQKLELKGKKLTLFLIDATWDSAKPILRLSKNLHQLPRISFTHTKTSAYGFKKQPFKEALSTMESVGMILEILDAQGVEDLTKSELDNFLKPFNEMVKLQKRYV